MKLASFFAGIGGFDLGFQRAGIEPVFHCEIDDYCQRILSRHWPKVPLHADISTLNPLDIPPADVWTAGWPCQDLSSANIQRKGLEGERSGLFFDFIGLARNRSPKWLVLENVRGLLSANQGADFETVIYELEKIGYVGIWFSANLRDIGLPQNRDRVYFIASYKSDRAYQFYSNGCELLRNNSSREASGEGREARSGFSEEPVSNSPLLVQRRGGFGFTQARNYSPTLRAQTGRHQGGHTDRPILCGQKLNMERMRAVDGVSRGLDGRRGRLIGNAVAPQMAEFIAKNILEIEGYYGKSTDKMAAE